MGTTERRPGERDGRRSQEDLDRELDEILSELRVVLPGVTVLFAFLLTVPFTADFEAIDTTDRAAYFLAFVASGVSMIFLVGESAYHRIVGRPYDKRQLTRTAGRQAVAGIASLAVALAAVAFLVTDVVYGRPLASGVSASLLALAVVVWFAFPLARRLQKRR